MKQNRLGVKDILQECRLYPSLSGAAGEKSEEKLRKGTNLMELHVYGGGLAGCEAAWQAARRGISVRLFEMKPKKFSPAHHSPGFAELVCSNSLRSAQTTNAVGLLKEEMRLLGSLVMEAADQTQVPAGSALAVDREAFSVYITEKLEACPLIEIVREEITSISDNAVAIVATGPLTSDTFADYLQSFVGYESLSFFDAAAPIVDAATVDRNKAFLASRYGKGEAAYLNCPMTKEEYDRFYEALVSAPEAPLKDFDRESQKLKVFEGCMPVEVMARRGYETLLYGPMKPVGLPDPKTGREAYAVLQLRAENREKTMYNMVGFQTHLTFEAQKQVFRLIPGLEKAEFMRYGVMHRNTFLNSPKLLAPDYSMRERGNVFFAGQMTGVEGYVESAASGLVAGINAARRISGAEPFFFSAESIIGALAAYVAGGQSADFQPMNANFGLIAALGERVRGGKRARLQRYAERSLSYITRAVSELDLSV